MRIHLPAVGAAPRAAVAATALALIATAATLSGCGGGNPYLDDNGGATGGGNVVTPITDSPYEGGWSGTWRIDTGIVVSGSVGADGAPTFVTVAPGGTAALEIEEDGDVTGTFRNTTTFTNGVLLPGTESRFSGRVQNDGALSGTLTTEGIEGGNALTGSLLFSLGDEGRLRGTVRQARQDGVHASGSLDLTRD